MIVTDKLASDQVAHRERMASVQHRRSKYLNRAENSHQPTGQRERAMKRVTSIRHAQRFLSAYGRRAANLSRAAAAYTWLHVASRDNPRETHCVESPLGSRRIGVSDS